MIKVEKLILFPHLPKTGGSSLANNIITKFENEIEYFRLAPKGRKETYLKRQFELTENLDTPQLILFGHDVDEGLLNYCQYDEIDLFTTLRHPLKRMVSHFNNVSNNLEDRSLTFDKFLSQKVNPSCIWYIRKFPSLIKNPFLPFLIQSLNIFSHFSSVFFTENSKDDFDRFMNILGEKFDPTLNINLGGISYPIVSTKEKVKSDNIMMNLNQDLQLYNAMQEMQSTLVTHNPLPKKKWKFHRWMITIINNTIWKTTSKDAVLKSTKDSFLEPIIKDQIEQSELNLQVLLQSIYEIQGFDNLNDEEKANILDVANFAIKNCEQAPFKNSSTKTKLQEILEINYAQKNRDIAKNIDIWDELPTNNEIVIQGHINTHLKHQNLEKAKEYLIKYCQISPFKHQPFFKLGRFYAKHCPEKEQEIIRCAQKVIEFYPKNKWANNQLKKIIINK